jgi:hypothetical protein
VLIGDIRRQARRPVTCLATLNRLLAGTMSAVRRLAAIVAADVPEYSGLIAADETTRHAPGPDVQLFARINCGDG